MDTAQSIKVSTAVGPGTATPYFKSHTFGYNEMTLYRLITDRRGPPNHTSLLLLELLRLLVEARDALLRRLGLLVRVRVRASVTVGA